MDCFKIIFQEPWQGRCYKHQGWDPAGYRHGSHCRLNLHQNIPQTTHAQRQDMCQKQFIAAKPKLYLISTMKYVTICSKKELCIFSFVFFYAAKSIIWSITLRNMDKQRLESKKYISGMILFILPPMLVVLCTV